MPTVFAHAITGAAAAQGLAPAKHRGALTLLGAAVATLTVIDATVSGLGLHGGLIIDWR